MRKLIMNPITNKELKLNARVIRFPLAVMLYAGVMTFAAMIILYSTTGYSYYYGYYSQQVDFNSLSQSFLPLAFVQLAMICIIVPILTSGSIAGERERQTLDIMLTAPIRPITIVGGKLMASLANVLIFVISSLPSMAICFLYGGMQWQNLLYFLVVMLVTAFFVGAVGIFSSAVFRKTIVSVIMTLIFECIFFLGTLVIVGMAYILKLRSIVEITGNYPSSGIDLGWLPGILLFNPVLGFAETLINLCNNYSIAENFLMNGLFGVINLPQGMDALTAHWGILSMLATILLGCFFLWMAARKVNGFKKNGGHQRSRRKRKKK